MRDRLRDIESSALKEIESSRGDRTALEEIRIRYLGRKGIITELFKNMDSLDPESRRETGGLINALKGKVLGELEAALGSAAVSTQAAERVDITLPGIRRELGSIHPVTKTIEEICDIFVSLGFMVVEGPEVETEYYNFEALNIPLEHPSRDAFDTFYLRPPGQKLLLRSHTSPVQARFMEKHKPPFSIVVPGRVFRPDATDASHSFMFHQVEGLAVSKDIKFSDLKGVLTLFAKKMFSPETKMRFRPSFFPFTEPSAEVDISCMICNKPPWPAGCESQGRQAHKSQRCSVCGGKGWLEILGAGMVNPKVFEAVGYDPEKYTGLAFGMGVERIAMLKYGINDIRMFFENDARFLRQF